ncbi:MAG: PKD domain-containing protein [Microscillaceae bacterium]|jgi:PKD repeat protein|nr:PKD domain-containing protein [Microscillaceae bacterium]
MKKGINFWLLIGCLSIIWACEELKQVPYIEFDARFNAPSIVREGDVVAFSPSFSTTGARNFSWDFGITTAQDDTSNAASPEYTYTKYGVYTVKMKVNIQKTNGLQKDSLSKEIIVIPPTTTPAAFENYGKITSDEVGYDMAILPDRSGYVIVGKSNINELLIIKTDNNFQVLENEGFPKTLNYVTNQQVFPKQILPTFDGGFLVVGSIVSNPNDSDAFIVKLDATGEQEWGEVINSLKNEYYVSVLETLTGSFIVAGSSEDVSGRSVIVIDQYASDGSKITAYTVPTASCSSCFAESMALTDAFNGEFTVVGVEVDNPVLLTFSDPETIDSKRVLLNINGTAKVIKPLSDGQWAIAGLTYTASTDSVHAFVAKVGSQPWVANLKMYSESFFDLEEDDDFNIIAVGSHYNPLSGVDMLVAKYEGFTGQELAVKLYGGLQYNEANGMLINDAGEVIIIGGNTNRNSPLGKLDVMMIKLNQNLE